MKARMHPILDEPPPEPAQYHGTSRLLKIFCVVCIVVQCASFLPSLFFSRPAARNVPQDAEEDLAYEWKDDTWPLRPPTPWDISTDFPYPRAVSYDVDEGTWLRLDVHPTSGDIVFDMLGDLYCIPGAAYAHLEDRARIDAKPSTAGLSPARAHPVLLGAPYDADPRFSPDGKTLVFRSDAELGVENIWAYPWTGCERMQLRPEEGAGAGSRTALVEALRVQAEEEDMLAAGVRETPARRRRRLIREGRYGARRVTNETYRWISDARVHPSGDRVVATKWYTSARSLGAGEGWEYPLPGGNHIPVGSGRQIIERDIPRGWSSEKYESVQVGPEQFIWNGEDGLVYSQNVADKAGVFEYSKDVHQGIYAIFARNLTTDETLRLVDAAPGGASRPELSRDGRTLAFVRRVRDKEALVLLDMKTGTLHHAWHGLTYDLSVISAPMGTYPSFAFTPSSSAIIIWAAGKIHHVPLATNTFGERIAHPEKVPNAIEFTARVEKRLARTLKSKTDLVALESAPTQRLRAFTHANVDDGKRIVFQGAGVSYFQDVDFTGAASAPASGGASHATRVPVLHPKDAYYAPSIVPHTNNTLVVHARFDNTAFTKLELADLAGGRAYAVTGLPRGRYRSPTMCACRGRERMVAFVKTAGTLLTGDVVETVGEGLYVGTFTLPKSGENAEHVEVENVRFVPTSIGTSSGVLALRFLDGNKRLLVQEDARAFVIDLAGGPTDVGGWYDETLVAEGKMSQELAVSVMEGGGVGHVAVVDFFNVYVANASVVNEPVWSKPGRAPPGLARVSLDGGHDIQWTSDGKRLFWFLGPYMHSLDVSTLHRCASAIMKDASTFGIRCTRSLLDVQEVYVAHETDIARLRAQARERGGLAGGENADVLVVENATVVTMETGRLHGDLIEGASVVVRAGVIENVGRGSDVDVPFGASVVNAGGGLVVPGFIDVHAHWGGFADPYPARSWEMEAFLAYGVTTLHNPSSSNVLGSVERGRVENDGMVGPRIFHTGDVIYGAGAPGIHQDIVDIDEARSALVRIKVEGGEAALSYKNYNQPSRAARQRLLLAARNLSMLCVPEGGMNWDWDLTYIMDGMTTVEHALPVSTLYADVLTLYAISGTGATPTHIVNYGGAFGEQYVWATEDIPNDPKLRRFTRHDILEGLTESTARPRHSYALFNTSASVANMVKQGLKAHIGAHGEPPLGLNYHAEMFFTQQGGLDNYEVLRAATIDAAMTLGLDSSIGSLAPGKLADFVVYPPGADIIHGDIRASRDIRYVARGGRLWDAQTMVEEWPMKGRRKDLPPINVE